jgi:glycosyltransferase involved in cell wall biosynthesis
MKINFVWPNDVPDNTNRGIYKRFAAFSESEYECALYTKHDTLIADRVAENVSIKRMPETRAPPIFETFVFKFWLLYSLLKADKPGECVYTIHALDYSIGFLVSNLLGQVWLIDAFHSPYYFIDFGRARGELITMLRGIKTIAVCKLILWNVDLAIVMAHSRYEGFAELISTDFNVSRDRIIAVPDGVDLDHTSPSNRSREIDERHGLELFHAGQISKSKGLDMMRGLSELPEAYSDVRLTIVGGVNPDFTAQFETYKRRSNVDIELVEYLPHDQLLAALEEADVGICTIQSSIRDYQNAHPVKIFEYLAMGKPVVATELEGIKRIVRHGYNGYTYPAGDTSRFAELIVELYEDEEALAAMTENARESVQEFHWSRINANMMDEFRDRYPRE